ncbi:MAG: hypothetical protein NC393_13960 [Clostridium sp.]|nr:hypothetical protein [Clostridium sp.]MCM1173217.1 hypothetical protein [Clostridium sp.]MCM1209406.1 hypothetical protein [Ruminococcus sp.]
MKNKKQVVLYIVLLLTGLLMIILQAFVFEAPDGFLGFLVCLVSVWLILGSVIKLCKLSGSFRDSAIDMLLDILDNVLWFK